MANSPACLVVGAGPAGLAAAIAAARAGARVLVLEKTDRPGRKLLLTGGGRANLWDARRPALEALPGFGRGGLGLRQCLAAFDWPGFLAALGVELESDDGEAYARGGARALLAALLERAAALGVEVRPGTPVRSARAVPGGGFEVATPAGGLPGRSLIVATGGLTWPGTGSSGDGYALAAAFGHAVDSPRPALGELVTDPCFPELAGTTVADAELLLAASGRRRRSLARGALLFAHRGFSGPAALDASLELARAGLSAGAALRADLAPGLSVDELAARLVERARAETKRTLASAGLAGLFSVRLLERLAGLAGLDARRRLGSLSDRELGRLAAAAKGLDLAVTEPADAGTAVITVGGVSDRELDPRTMESRLVPGLFFAGEVLAPAGPCGGYNLLAAFATGTAAGVAAAPDPGS